MNDIVDPIIGSGAFKAASFAIGIFSVFFALALLYWLYRDSSERGMMAGLWAGLVTALAVAGGIFGLTASKYGFAPAGISVFGVVIFCTLIYLIIRPSEYKDDIDEHELGVNLIEAELDVKACPKCRAGIEPDFVMCPECLIPLRKPCTYCGRPIKTGWKVCPYCSSRQS